MGRIYLAFVFLLLGCGANAQPNLPQIAESAASYRQTIDGLSVSSTVPQLLRAIRHAEAGKKTAERIQLYEQLVHLDSGNFRTWLQLGVAWREAEPFAEKGLSAAFNANRVAAVAPDQLEALLLMSSLLRARLDRYQK